MAIDYATQGSMQSDKAFQERLGQAVASAALAISGEVQGGSTMADWTSRQSLAHNVLSGGSSRVFHQPVLANIGAGVSTATDQTGITDGELDTAVASVWNDVAGIFGV